MKLYNDIGNDERVRYIRSALLRANEALNQARSEMVAMAIRDSERCTPRDLVDAISKEIREVNGQLQDAFIVCWRYCDYPQQRVGYAPVRTRIGQ